MAYYDLNKEERQQLSIQIQDEIEFSIVNENYDKSIGYFSDDDTYVRKAAYLGVGKIYLTKEINDKVFQFLERLLVHEHHHVRQTVINSAGEIGMKEFKVVESFFDRGLFDEAHTVRNAVIGSLKKMSKKNPKPTLNWAKQYLSHKDKEVRREICHGIELRGRTHPEDILPLLAKLQFEKTARVRNTLVHVLGQISYKKDCLPKVVSEFNNWEDKGLVRDAIDEIIDVHSEKRYAKFTALTQQEVVNYIDEYMNEEL